ncbi:MAG: hypothetical protein AAGE61_17445 [Pseudomonadota bacterium]
MGHVIFTYRTTDACVYRNGDYIGRVLERRRTLYGNPDRAYEWFDAAGGKGEAPTLKEALEALKARYR